MKTLLVFLFVCSLASADSQSRVIAMSPALTEMVFALKLNSHLVGVSDFSNYPDLARELPSVGPYTQPNMEKILHLHPDLVLINQEGPEDVRMALNRLHIKYDIISMRMLKEIGEAAVKVAADLGEPDRGQNFKKTWDDNLRQAFSEASQKRQKVFIEIQKNPLIAVGSNTFLDEIVKGCGGQNLVTDSGYPKISLERVIKWHPDFVFLADYFPTEKEREDALLWWKPRAKDVIALDENTTSRPGPRLLAGIKSLCGFLR